MSDIPFDTPDYLQINQVREEWLTPLLPMLPNRSGLLTALDLGCGAGYFSGLLHRAGFRVTGLDLRPANVQRCRERYPACRFDLIDLDDTSQLSPEKIGTFDLVLMFGLLYHLQSPLQVILRLAPCIGELAIIETRVAQGNAMACYFHREYDGDDQNTASIVAVPTFSACTAIFAASGLPHIYIPDYQPAHPQWDPQRFPNGLRKHFVVSRQPLAIPGHRLVEASEPIWKWEPIS